MELLIFYGIKSSKYNNKGARQTYEKETKNEITNLVSEDERIGRRTGLTSSVMTGANNNRIEGEKITVKKNS